MNWMERAHECFIHDRRTRVLACEIEPLLTHGSSVLDVGCGDGLLDRLILEKRPDLSITGLDTTPRLKTHIQTQIFDGTKIPHEDKSFDITLFVDVLHHVHDVRSLLMEACRVSREGVVIKDHLCNNRLDYLTLKFMDTIGNKRHRVALPFHYLSKKEWVAIFSEFGLKIERFKNGVKLYPSISSIVFRSHLQFVAKVRFDCLCEDP